MSHLLHKHRRRVKVDRELGTKHPTGSRGSRGHLIILVLSTRWLSEAGDSSVHVISTMS